MNYESPQADSDPKLEIVDATADDAEDYRKLEYETWKNTYVNENTNITEDDVDWLFSEKRHAFSKEGLDNFSDELENMPEGNKAIVVKDGGKIVGATWLMNGSDQNEIGSIYISPEYQGQGLGKKLWVEAENFFDPAKESVVTVNKENAQAIAYYESLGFKIEGDVEAEFAFPSGATYEEIRMVRQTDKWVMEITEHTTGVHHPGEYDLEKIPIETVSLKEVVGFEPDEKMESDESKAKVDDMASHIQDGTYNEPPIPVRRHLGGYQALDGHHRFYAHREANSPTIDIRVIPDEDIVYKDSRFSDTK